MEQLVNDSTANVKRGNPELINDKRIELIGKYQWINELVNPQIMLLTCGFFNGKGSYLRGSIKSFIILIYICLFYPSQKEGKMVRKQKQFIWITLKWSIQLKFFYGKITVNEL